MMTRKQYYVALAVLAVTGLVGGGLVSCLTPAKVVSAQKEVADVVTAREFRVVDEDGKKRAELVAKGGLPRLTLYDAAGQDRVSLIAINRGASLKFCDAKGTLRAALSAFTVGSGLNFYDAAGELSAILGATATGSSLNFFGAEGEARVSLAADKGSPLYPGLALNDAAGNTRALFTLVEGNPGIALWGEAGSVIWEAP